MSVFIGIDPGLTGAWAALNWCGEVLVLHDLPTMAAGGKGAKVQRQIDPASFSAELVLLRGRGEAITAAVERITAMPGQGVASMFSMGDTFGSLRAALALSGVPVEFPSSGTWKRAMGLDSDKERSRTKAIQLFPGHAQYLKRKADHNRAEALLLAEWLRRRLA